MTGDYAIATDPEKLSKLGAKILEADRTVGFDLETGYLGPDRVGGSLDWDWDEQFVVGLSLSPDPRWARYVPLRHDMGGNAREDEVWDALKPLLTKGKIVPHHEKFELRGVRKAAGYTLCSDGGTLRDTMLEHYALGGIFPPPRHLTATGTVAEALRAAFGLKEMTETIFGHKMATLADLFGGRLTETQLKCVRFNPLDLRPEVVAYACEDAAWALALHAKLDVLAREERPLMHALEHEISQIMADVEELGVAVDWEGMAAAWLQGEAFLPAMETAVKAGLGELAERDCSALNLNSVPQMQALLYRDIGFATTRKTKGADKKPLDTPAWKKMSTDEQAMAGLAKKHPPIRKLLDYREVQNLQTRLCKWLEEVKPYSRDGRAHANYNQVVVGTGRFAADDPAIQQCPSMPWRWTTVLGLDVWKDEAAWEALVADCANGTQYWTGHFRDFIVAAEGTYLLTFDYATMEMRILAGVSQEPSLMTAFEQGIDVHRATAAMMLGKRVEDVADEERQDFGKRMNFALIYQQGPQAMAEQLACSLERAKQLFAQYFATFSRVQSWQETVISRGLQLGYAETCFGRKYVVWELKSSSPAIQAKGKRVLVNAPIQGGAADYTKFAMVKVTRELKRRGWWMNGCTIVMNHHDSLTFEVSNRLDPNEVRAVIEPLVTFPIRSFPEIVADWEIGQRWGSSEKWTQGARARWNGERWTLGDDEVKAPERARVETVKEVDSEPVRIDRTSNAPVNGTGVTISVGAMPTREAFERLLAFNASMPGRTEVTLRCPAGAVTLGTSSLSVADAGRVSMIMGGATVTASASEAEIASLGESMR